MQPPFEVADYKQWIADGYNWKQFKVGTCTGLFAHKNNAYNILAIENSQQGNGHFGYTMDWFESSCRRDGMDLIFHAVLNEKFKTHLIIKRGFKIHFGINLIKKSFPINPSKKTNNKNN